MKKVLIIGGGFGGVYSAIELLKSKFEVTIVNDNNYFIYQPLLHEVSTGNLEISDIIFDYYSFFNNKNFKFIKTKINKINFDKKIAISSNNSKIKYDYLIISTGSRTNFYNIKGARENSYELKNINDSIKIKKKILDITTNKKVIDINVIGAGPTGIELIFEISDFLKELQRYHIFKYNLNLINSHENILNQYDNKTKKYVLNLFEKKNINYYKNQKIKEIEKHNIIEEEKNIIKTDLTILVAGIIPNSELISQNYLDEKSNIIVNDYLQIPNKKYEFAIGDVSNIKDSNIPKLAQTAVQQAKIVSLNIINLEKNKKLQKYELKLKGQLLSLGKFRAAGNIYNFSIKGFHAWIIWRTIYLIKTPGIKNKLKVATSWTFNLFEKRDMTNI